MNSKVEAIVPESISAESERWSASAEGILKRLVWQIETGQIKPKELVVAYFDYKGGEGKALAVESTQHNPVKINGLFNLATKRHSDKVLYDD